MPDARYSGTDNLEMMKEAVNYNRWLVQLVRDRARKKNRLLDFGAGVGTLALELARDGYRVECVEPDADQREILSAAGLPAHADLTSIEDESIDFAYTFNVLEHIDDDRGALRTVERLLRPGGQLLLAVPSNPREWRWDDDFYGHFRRYTVADMTQKLTQAGFEARAFWDFTFPWFWLMRRMYTRVKTAPPAAADKDASTKASATVNAWDVPLLSKLLDRTAILWYPLHRLQFRLFRNATRRGHEFFVLARKPA